MCLLDIVQFCFTAIPADGVIGWSMDVPAGHVQRLVVHLHARQSVVHAFIVIERKGWSVAPVVELAGGICSVPIEVWSVSLGQTLVEEQRDWRLLRAGLA